MMVFMVAGAPWCRGRKGEFGNQRAPGCVSGGFNQVTRGTPALQRGGDLLQPGLGARTGAGGPCKGHTEGEALLPGGSCSLESPSCWCWQGLDSSGNGAAAFPWEWYRPRWGMSQTLPCDSPRAAPKYHPELHSHQIIPPAPSLGWALCLLPSKPGEVWGENDKKGKKDQQGQH